MRNRFFIFTTLFIVALAISAAAHPLSNFSVNYFSRIEIEKSQVRVRVVVDLAEIPTFQAAQEIDTDKDGTVSQTELAAYAEKITPEYVSNLMLSVDSQKVDLRPSATKISQPPGAGNLPTLRIEWDLTGDLPASDAGVIRKFHYENKNGLERIGWNEIVVGRVSGINIFDSTAYGSGASEELKSYPQESLSSPLTERTANFSFTTNAIPPSAKILQNRDGHVSAPIEKDKFAELIAVPEITPTIILLGLLVAFGLGAAHALSPGHGKAVVGAYLIGTKGTPKHAVFLGLTVTITHTLGVFAFGFIMLFATRYILPEHLVRILSFISGLLVFLVGVTLFRKRIFPLLGYKKTEHKFDESLHDIENLDGDFTHTHGGSTHSHLPPKKVTWKNLLALGISGGLLPCPSALVLMLSAVSLNRIGYGIILTLVFSFGLAATLTAIGLTFLYVGKFFDNPNLSENRIIKALPVFSAFVIACVGAAICYQSIP